MNIFNSFINSYARQIARNAANDNYYQEVRHEVINSSDYTLSLPSTKNYIWWCIGLFFFGFPFCPLNIISAIMIIKGLKRYFSKNAKIYTINTEAVFKSDRRYSTGEKYLGNVDVKQYSYINKSSLSELETKEYNKNALIYIFMGIFTIIVPFIILASI